jgi:putative pyruvate formate lyase activating enzyme
MAERTWPAYLGLANSGELTTRVERAEAMLESCSLCPRACGVDRTAGETGFCRAGDRARVSSAGPHYGEEQPLVGRSGSGTIFLTHCNLGCVYCQNYDISHLDRGNLVSTEVLGRTMCDLQDVGCHNINLVTPTHFMPQILQALTYAVEHGLRLPLVWNCGGYESREALELLDGIVDIYMPDAKYADSDVAAELSSAPDYPERMREALREMHRQVGDLQVDRGGVARRGLLVRHLVLPGGRAGTRSVLAFLAELSRNTYINIMAQYRPCYRAREHEGMDRRPTSQEMRDAFACARELGLERLDERRARLWG